MGTEQLQEEGRALKFIKGLGLVNPSNPPEKKNHWKGPLPKCVGVEALSLAL